MKAVQYIYVSIKPKYNNILQFNHKAVGVFLSFYIPAYILYIYIYFLSKTVCDPTTQQVPVATGSGFNTLEQILSITTVPVEPPPKIQEYIHQRVQVFV